MGKKSNLLLWVVAIVLLLVAASIVYTKNKPQGGIEQKNIYKTVEDTKNTDNINTSETTNTVTTTSTQLAPDFNLKDTSGKSIKLSDYRGKIVILNFWTVGCKYCKLEMPDLNELNQELEKKNDVIILAIDATESLETVKEYLEGNMISLHVLLDSDGAVTKTYGVPGFPTTFVLNRDGSLFTYVLGATSKAELLDIISKIK